MNIQDSRFAKNIQRFYVLYLTRDGNIKLDSTSFNDFDSAHKFLENELKQEYCVAGKVINPLSTFEI